VIFTTNFAICVKKSLTSATIFTQLSYSNIKNQISSINKLRIMRSILYLIAIVFVILWATGYFAFSVGYLIHALLVIAIIAFLLGIIRGRRF